MANSAIFRLIKIKARDDIGRIGKHNDRDKDHLPANVDPKRVKDNITLKGSGNSLEEWDKRTAGIPIRKNGVLAYDVVMTFSEEKDIDINKWQQANIKFLEKKFGKKNVLNVWCHNDESTPHLHALVVPLVMDSEKKKEKFNARHFTGGADALTKLQDEYYEAMKQFNLDRGVKGSRAKHVSQKEYHKRSEAMKKRLEKMDKETLMKELITAKLRIESLEQEKKESAQKLTGAKETINSLTKEKAVADNKINYFENKIKEMSKLLTSEELAQVDKTLNDKEELLKFMKSLTPSELKKITGVGGSTYAEKFKNCLNVLNPLPNNAVPHEVGYSKLKKYSSELKLDSFKKIADELDDFHGAKSYKDAVNQHNYSLAITLLHAMITPGDNGAAISKQGYLTRLEKMLENQGYTQDQIKKILESKEQTM